MQQQQHPHVAMPHGLTPQQPLHFGLYQGGPTVELLSLTGGKDAAFEGWTVNGGVKRLYDKSVRGFVAGVDGSGAALQLPKTSRQQRE